MYQDWKNYKQKCTLFDIHHNYCNFIARRMLKYTLFGVPIF